MAHIILSCQVGRAQKCGIMKQADIKIGSLRGHCQFQGSGEGFPSLRERAWGKGQKIFLEGWEGSQAGNLDTKEQVKDDAARTGRGRKLISGMRQAHS